MQEGTPSRIYSSIFVGSSQTLDSISKPFPTNRGSYKFRSEYSVLLLSTTYEWNPKTLALGSANSCYLRGPRAGHSILSRIISDLYNLNHRGQLHLPLNSWLRPSLWMNQWWCSGGVNSAFYEARHNMLTLWKARVYHVRPVRTAIYNTFTTPSRIVPRNAVHSSSSPPTHANPVFRFGFDSVHGGLVKRRNSYVYAGCFDVSYAQKDACRTLFRKQIVLVQNFVLLLNSE